MRGDRELSDSDRANVLSNLPHFVAARNPADVVALAVEENRPLLEQPGGELALRRFNHFLLAADRAGHGEAYEWVSVCHGVTLAVGYDNFVIQRSWGQV
jgi:hypothetical protein